MSEWSWKTPGDAPVFRLTAVSSMYSSSSPRVCESSCAKVSDRLPSSVYQVVRLARPFPLISLIVTCSFLVTHSMFTRRKNRSLVFVEVELLVPVAQEGGCGVRLHL